MKVSLQGRIVATAGASGAHFAQDEIVPSVITPQVRGHKPNDLLVKPMVSSRLARRLEASADAYAPSIDFATSMVR